MSAFPWWADPDLGCVVYRHPRRIAVVTEGPPQPAPRAPRHPAPRPPRGLSVNHRGMRLWRWRQEQHLQQRRVAELLGVRPGQVSRWERGVDTMPGKYLPQLGITGRKYMVEG